jgi:hypothetical protein
MNDDMAYSGSPITATMVTAGPFVHISIIGNFATVSNFGTGQLYLEMPFTCLVESDFAGGHIHDQDKTSRYLITGECEAGSDRLTLLYLSGNKAELVPLTNGSLVALATTDTFTMSTTIIREE